MPEPQQNPAAQPPGFRTWRLVAVIVAVLLGISVASRWYARNVTLPRYCEYPPAQTLERVRRLLQEKAPAGNGERKPYIVAARLTFLIPREGGEPLDDYLRRLESHLRQQCP